MKKNHLSTETLVFEIISAIAALFYMGLQVYYGIVYGAGAVRIVMNVLILILVYMGLTVLAIYPERVNGTVARGLYRRDTQIYDPHGGIDQTGICVVSSFYQHLRCVRISGRCSI